MSTMEPPYGQCNASNPEPMSNCIINCRTQMIVDVCGCRNTYMQNLTESKSLTEYSHTDVNQSATGCKLPTKYQSRLCFGINELIFVSQQKLQDPMETE